MPIIPQKNVELDLCSMCESAAEDMVNDLLNYIANAGIAGGCGALCGQLSNQVEQEICTLGCSYLGIEGFADLVEKLNINPDNLCFDIHLCHNDTASAAPTAANSFCADMSDSLYLNKTVVQQMNYSLCMDVPSLSWKREDADPAFPGKNVVQIFANNRFAKITNTAEGPNCTYYDAPQPASPTDMPFVFIVIDSDATNNGTKTWEDEQCTWYNHFRPAQHGAISVPAENMNWLVDPSRNGALALSDCIQHYGVHPGDGGNSTTSQGMRNYFAGDYTPAPLPDDTFKLPAGMSIKDCTKIEPPQPPAFEEVAQMVSGLKPWVV